MNLNLYNILTEYRQIAERIIEAGGEITDQDFETLQINKESLQVKAIQFALITKENENDVEAIEKEIERLSTLKTVRGNVNTRLRETIKSAMQLYGVSEIKGENFKISFRKSKSVEIEDENLLPDKYKQMPTVLKILKKEIGDDIKAGIDVPGASLKENQNLQIK